MSHNGCPKCGASIGSGGKTCGSCGAVSSTFCFVILHSITHSSDYLGARPALAGEVCRENVEVVVAVVGKVVAGI